jgi:hypothetical protein
MVITGVNGIILPLFNSFFTRLVHLFLLDLYTLPNQNIKPQRCLYTKLQRANLELNWHCFNKFNIIPFYISSLVNGCSKIFK